MRKLRTWIVLLIFALLAIVLLTVFRREREPSYEGRRLSEWLALYASRPPDYFFTPTPSAGGFSVPPGAIFAPGPAMLAARPDKPNDAIRHIGTNALPCLLAWLDYEPEPWKVKVASMLQKLPKWISRSRPLTLLLDTGVAQERAGMSCQAFAALGPIAAPAIPELTRRSMLTNSSTRKLRAIAALFSIGPDAYPAMMTVLSNPNWKDNLTANIGIQNMWTNARLLVPLLVQDLQNTNLAAAVFSAASLRVIKFDADLVVPALTRSLADPREDVRFEVATSLRQFGKLARPALSALSNALNDPDPVVRDAVTNAIRTIAPPELGAEWKSGDIILDLSRAKGLSTAPASR